MGYVLLFPDIIHYYEYLLNWSCTILERVYEFETHEFLNFAELSGSS